MWNHNPIHRWKLWFLCLTVQLSWVFFPFFVIHVVFIFTLCVLLPIFDCTKCMVCLLFKNITESIWNQCVISSVKLHYISENESHKNWMVCANNMKWSFHRIILDDGLNCYWYQSGSLIMMNITDIMCNIIVSFWFSLLYFTLDKFVQ